MACKFDICLLDEQKHSNHIPYPFHSFFAAVQCGVNMIRNETIASDDRFSECITKWIYFGFLRQILCWVLPEFFASRSYGHSERIFARLH